MASPSVLTPGTKVLICWFTRTGYTKRVVEILKPRLSADLFEIQTAVKYTGIIGGIRSIAHSMTGGGPRGQQLTTALPDLSVYDVFIVACPIWNFVHPSPVAAFLAAADFGGKPVIGLATCASKMRGFNDALGADVVTGRFIAKDAFYDVGNKSQEVLEEDVTRWLDGL
jgi:flavodoxin